MCKNVILIVFDAFLDDPDGDVCETFVKFCWFSFVSCFSDGVDLIVCFWVV